jgi:hypothetical protein
MKNLLFQQRTNFSIYILSTIDSDLSLSVLLCHYDTSKHRHRSIFCNFPPGYGKNPSHLRVSAKFKFLTKQTLGHRPTCAAMRRFLSQLAGCCVCQDADFQLAVCLVSSHRHGLANVLVSLAPFH